MHLKPNTYLHKKCFKIIKQIDQGGFGITYLAEETGWLQSTGYGEQYKTNAQPDIVVIKELYFDDFCSRNEETGLVYVTNINKKVEFEKLVNKQLEEGRIIKNLNHQNIVNTKDIFKENDTAYMVLEYVDGINLEKIVNEEGKFSQTKAMEYIEKILSAVTYIHEKKVLHLDITPSNILIKKSNNEPVLIDFGASQTYSTDNHIASTTSKLVAGFKKHYAPIEQEDIDKLKEFDATFDTYAVGATLYFMLTGTPPPIASYMLSGREELIPISSLNSTVNPPLDNVVAKALNIKYRERYKTAWEMLQDIERAIAEKKVKTQLVTGSDKPKVDSSGALKSETLLTNDNRNIDNQRLKTDTSTNKKASVDPPNGKKSYLAYYIIGIAVAILIIAKIFSPSNPPEVDPISIDSTSIDSNAIVPAMPDTSSGTVDTSAKLVSPNSSEESFNLGTSYEEGSNGKSPDYAEAKKYLTESSEKGYGPAQINLGNMYFGGEGMDKNYLEAFKWFKKAADQPSNLNNYGNGAANFNIAQIFFGGYGISKDYNKSFEYCKKAANYGLKDAQSFLGEMYTNGYGTEKNLDEAGNWYRKAADQGDATGECNLADMYENGAGNIPENYSEAFRLYKLASDQNIGIASYSIGEMYENAKIGGSINKTLAVKWYKTALDQGSDDAKQALQRLGVQ